MCRHARHTYQLGADVVVVSRRLVPALVLQPSPASLASVVHARCQVDERLLLSHGEPGPQVGVGDGLSTTHVGRVTHTRAAGEPQR